MASIVLTTPITYTPVWNPLEETYVDICPFEPRKIGNTTVCHCRSKQDTFNNMSQFKTHINKKHHKDWIGSYGTYVNEELIQVKTELTELRKEFAKQSAALEKQTKRAERYKLKFETQLQQVIPVTISVD